MRRWGGWRSGRHDGGALRRQPPVHSPLAVRHVARALRTVAGRRSDPREQLRRRLAERFSADEVALCGSGTHALEVAIRVARGLAGGLGPVALPAFTCYDVATAAVGADARVVLYDVEPETLVPDLDSCVAAMRRGARVLVVTPLFGYPCDWQALSEATDAFGAVLIEDAAQGHGAKWRGRPQGSLGRLSVLSFGRGKGWTGGGGGACLARGPAAAGILAARRLEPPPLESSLHVLAGAVAQAVFGGPRLYWLPASLPGLHLGRTVYRRPTPPRGMTALSAALILETESDADGEALHRRGVGLDYLRRVPVTPWVRPIRPAREEDGGYLRAPVLVSDGMVGFPSESAARRLGIEASYPSTIGDLLPLRARLDHPVARCPGGEYLARHLVTLPTHQELSPGDREQVLRLLDSYGVTTRWEPASRAEAGARATAADPRSRAETLADRPR